MRFYRLLGVMLFGILVSSGTVGHSVATPVAKDVGVWSHLRLGCHCGPIGQVYHGGKAEAGGLETFSMVSRYTCSLVMAGRSSCAGIIDAVSC